MKIFIAGYDPQRIGGGWGFARNFYKAFRDEVVFDLDQADTYFIPGASMTSREEVQQAKKLGKRIVLRVDNALLPANNRGGGMTHLKDFADWADDVIYQSQWAQEYLGKFLGKFGTVIINAVDRDVFNPNGRKDSPGVFGYIRSSRHETKGWEPARYYYSRLFASSQAKHLLVVGKFSPDMLEYNFNFYAGEPYTYLGEQPQEKMPEVYRQIETLIVPYFNDACSNTLIEALCCGCKLYDNLFLQTGGTPEILEKFAKYGSDYFHLGRMEFDYRAALNA